MASSSPTSSTSTGSRCAPPVVSRGPSDADLLLPLQVAEDEAKHFSLLVALLNKRGVNYGDHPVHAGLWDSARETSHSLRARLAIIHMGPS